MAPHQNSALPELDSEPWRQQDGRLEWCDTCEADTRHDVRVDIINESDTDTYGSAREPYRISTCRQCDTTTTLRLNTA